MHALSLPTGTHLFLHRTGGSSCRWTAPTRSIVAQMRHIITAWPATMPRPIHQAVATGTGGGTGGNTGKESYGQNSKEKRVALPWTVTVPHWTVSRTLLILVSRTVRSTAH